MGLFNRNLATPSNQDEVSQEIADTPCVPALVDTSVIIDGRIVDIAKAGFAPGKLLVPRFVLAELQLIADSGDAMKRSRGRRGLEMLHTMREAGVDLEIIEYDYDDIKEVDAKLVRLGRHLNANVLTTDYNLNRVASIEGVRVLNINELANAVRPVVLPGEHMFTKIVQAGKEKNQGVGYLADGTMIVVDSGDRLIGQEVEVEITRVFQTVAGKMLFAILANPHQVQPRTEHKPQNRPNPSQQLTQAQSQPQPGSPVKSLGSDSRLNQKPQERKNQPRKADANGQRRNQPNPSRNASKPNSSAQGANSGSNDADRRRPKRMSPTQRLENSLVELTKVDNDSE